MKTSLLAVMLLSLSIHSYAQRDSKGGGGGDASESRVDEIRADILSWINKGGSQGLKFTNGITLEEYNQKMIELLTPKAVVVTFVEKEDSQDDELQVSVDGKPKTCRGFFSRQTARPSIVCHIARFAATSPSEQYKLIHHEYAGLGYLEKNDGAASDYEISNQITEYLEETKVLKLAIKKPSSSSLLNIKDCSNAYEKKAIKRAKSNRTLKNIGMVAGTVAITVGTGGVVGPLLGAGANGAAGTIATAGIFGGSASIATIKLWAEPTEKNNYYKILRGIEASKIDAFTYDLYDVFNKKLDLESYSDQEAKAIEAKIVAKIKLENSKGTFCPVTKNGVKVMNLRTFVKTILKGL